jgi:hypothetical protein
MPARCSKAEFVAFYLRDDVYWFGKMVKGRRNVLSLGTRDYVEAVARAREISNARAAIGSDFSAEIDRFLKHKVETNRFSQASAETKAYLLKLFADHLRNAPPSHVTGHQCKSFCSACQSTRDAKLHAQ